MVALLILGMIDTTEVLEIKNVTPPLHVEIALVGKVNIKKGTPGKIEFHKYCSEHIAEEVKLTLKADRVFIGLKDVKFIDWDETPEFDVYLPPNMVMEVELNLGAARFDIDLGGLTITRLELNTGAIKGRISCTGRASVEAIELNVGAAKLAIEDLGNISPKLLDINCGVSNLTLSLNGDWSDTCDIHIVTALSKITVKAPTELDIQLITEGFLTGDTQIVHPAPQVRIKVDGALNHVKLRCYRDI
ncbi:hypothetical protein J7J56_00880 [candidate division WOR-3 bacterium]|nr:hypothetical protein [candidate division WOR-3 bacterium]